VVQAEALDITLEQEPAEQQAHLVKVMLERTLHRIIMQAAVAVQQPQELAL
jgi:hypothetical protein